MIWFFAERGVEKWLACGLIAMRIRFDGDKDGVDLCQLFGIVAPKCPAAIGFVVYEENAEINGPVLGRFILAPDLECARVLEAGLAVRIECVKNEGIALRIGNAPV